MLSHIADHVVIDKTFLVLVRIHQTLIAYAVNHPRNTGGDLEHPVNGGVGEDILPAAGIPQMRLYVSFTVCPVQWRQRAVHIDSLPDCCIPLKFKLIIPELSLSDQHQRHRTLRVKAVVQQETELLEHLLIQEVGFIENTDDPLFLHTLDNLDGFLKLTL